MTYIVSLLLVIALLAMGRKALPRVTIFEFERGLRYLNGRFVGILGPGKHWAPTWNTNIQRVDMRGKFASIAGQELLSSDGVGLKVSLAAKYQVVDPETAVNRIEDYQAALHLEIQLALRHIVAGMPMDGLLEKRDEIGKRLLEIAAPKVEALGLRLDAVEIKDIMFPGELKKIYTQVVKARQEGLAALEMARGETAALRNLANAAQMVERNPALLQLRLLQAIGQNSGNTVVLNVSGADGPIPLKQGADRAGDAPT